MRFTDRTDAGRRLGARLGYLAGQDAVVLGLPRGGVVVAAEVSRALGAPLDVIVVRKLGVPFQPELAMGAIGQGGVRVINEEVVERAGIGEEEIAAVEVRERAELERRAERFRAGRDPVDIARRIAVIVDDGIATGSTARAACQVARLLGAAKVILAVPVGAPQSISALSDVCDETACLSQPEFFFAVGQWYADFRQVGDAEVAAILSQAGEPEPPGPPPKPRAADPESTANSTSGARAEEVELRAGTAVLAGRLVVPDSAKGVVVFVHGSGSSRLSPRNTYVARELNQAGLGTLLFDLLTHEEELDRANVFDVELLAGRLTEVTGWLRAQLAGSAARIGYFGASTGAAAALWAAAQADADIAAIVSRGGRPDLAGQRLAAVRAPTLLIVGGRDDVVLGLNMRARESFSCESELVVVPGATHLFEEPGALTEVTHHALSWFTRHFSEGDADAGRVAH